MYPAAIVYVLPESDSVYNFTVVQTVMKINLIDKQP